MCLGINRLTFWCGPQTRWPRLAHIAKSAIVCATPRLVLAARAHPTVGNEAGMCPGINRFTKCAPIADWVRRGVPLWCSRVLVPAALPWLGPEREGRKGPPLRLESTD